MFWHEAGAGQHFPDPDYQGHNLHSRFSVYVYTALQPSVGKLPQDTCVAYLSTMLVTALELDSMHSGLPERCRSNRGSTPLQPSRSVWDAWRNGQSGLLSAALRTTEHLQSCACQSTRLVAAAAALDA